MWEPPLVRFLSLATGRPPNPSPHSSHVTLAILGARAAITLRGYMRPPDRGDKDESSISPDCCVAAQPHSGRCRRRYVLFTLTAVAESKRPAVVDRRPEKPLACTQSDGTRLTRFVEQTTRTFPRCGIGRLAASPARAPSPPAERGAPPRLYCGADNPSLPSTRWRGEQLRQSCSSRRRRSARVRRPPSPSRRHPS